MKTIVRVGGVAALTLAAACGSSDGDAEDAADDDVAEVVETPAEEPDDFTASGTDSDTTDDDSSSDTTDGGDDSVMTDADPDATTEATDDDAGADETVDEDAEPGTGDESQDGTSSDSDSDSGSNAGSDSDGGGGSVGADEIPDECFDLMGNFLVTLEPQVEGIDWDTVTLGELDQSVLSLDTPELTALDAEMEAAGCNDLAVEDDEAFTQLIDLARKTAPGTIGWLEFMNSLAGSLSPETAGEPATCEEEIAAVMELVETTESFSSLPAREVAEVSQRLTNLNAICDTNDVLDLFEDPAFIEWSEF